MTQHTQPPHLQALIAAEPDLVDRIFDYLLTEFPQLGGPEFADAKQAVRNEFGGSEAYVRLPRGRAEASQETARRVLELFNGRNATEVARSLKISRASVYRALKQAGKR